MIFSCNECKTEISVSTNAVNNEVISCPICGMDYLISVDENGLMGLIDLEIEGEDFGE